MLYDCAMIADDQLAALDRDFEKIRHAERRARFRAAGGRPCRRARTRHHHRCRLSLFPHRKPRLHRRRHARPRAIYPQHGDRRLDRRSRDHPDRRAQGHPAADAPPRLHRLHARRARRGARDQQDGPRRLQRGAFQRDRRRLPRHGARAEFPRHRAAADLGAQWRQYRHALPSARPGSRARRCCPCSKISNAPAPHGRGERLPLPGAMGQPPQSRFSRLFRLGRRRRDRGRRRNRLPALGQDQPRASESSPRTATSTRQSPASRSR